MAIKTVTRTHRARIRNQRQVCDGLDTLGFAVTRTEGSGWLTIPAVS